MDFSPDKLRARFAELTEKVEAIQAKRNPVRAKRDDLVAKQIRELSAADAAVRKAEAGLFDLDQERALIARALGGKTLAE